MILIMSLKGLGLSFILTYETLAIHGDGIAFIKTISR